MFDDPKKELEALEKQLLEDEAWFEKELDSAMRMIGQKPQNPQRVTAPRTPQTPKPAVKAAPARSQEPSRQQIKKPEPEQEPPMPEKKGITGLLVLAGLETLGILGLIAYWVLFLLK